MKRRVVITGLGAVTASGEGAEALWSAALEGRSGIETLPLANGSWKPIGAAVRDFSPDNHITQKKALKLMARDIQLAVAAADLALLDSGIDLKTAARDRIGVIVGSGVLNHDLDELAASISQSLDEQGNPHLRKFGEEGLHALFPLWLLKYLPNMPACHISILFDLQGPNNTVTTGPSAGLQAAGEALRIIERGAADCVLTGGAESKLNPVGLSRYEVMGVLASDAGEDPKRVYRPFDARARGLVVGEGAAFLLLEELGHAKRRGARIYAELAGFGSSSLRGRVSAMESALEDARARAGEIEYLEACGLGIPEEDELELGAMVEVFGPQAGNLAVSSSKPVTGFAGFASGPLDLLLTVLSVFNGRVAPILNLENPRRPGAFSWVKEAFTKKINFAMTNAFGLQGQCATCVVRSMNGGARLDG